MYFLVNIHINNQSTLYKVNSVPHPRHLPCGMNSQHKAYLHAQV
jgi:hypothetical protein